MSQRISELNAFKLRGRIYKLELALRIIAHTKPESCADTLETLIYFVELAEFTLNEQPDTDQPQPQS